MFKLHSVTGRVFIGKLAGLFLGFIVMLLMPTFGFPGFSFIGLGILIMFVLMGAMIGFIGQFDRHPMIGFRMPWWFSGPMVGLVFMLMFVLLSYDSLELVMSSTLISWTGLVSPFWALLDGIFVGGLIALLEKTLAGEGPNLPLS